MPNKAKLVTREATTSTVTSDNLNKGSALEFTELDSNMINLRDQTFGVVGDDSATIDVGAGDTLYIRGGTNVTTSTNSDGSITINSSGGSANTGTLTLTGNQIKTNGDNVTLLSTDSQDDFNTIKCGEIHIDIGDTSTPNNKFVFNGNGITSNGGLNTLKLSAQEHNSDTTNDANIGQLYFKHIEYHNSNVYHSIRQDGDLVFRGNHDSGPNANSGGHYPYIALREYTDNGAIEIIPKPGKEVQVDGVDIKDNTISTNSSNANLEISANGSGKVEISGIKYPTSDGSANQVLQTDGSGNLSFANQTATSSGFKIVGDDSAGVDIADGGTLYVQGGTNVTTSTNSDGTITINATDTTLNLIDEDNMASNSATRPPSQQSVKAYVDAEVAGIVDSAPGTLNTLNELAAALGDDANFATTTSTSLGNRLRIDTNAQGLTSTQKTNATTNLGLNAVATSGAYSDLSGTPTIPSNNNELTNGAGYITDANITLVGDDSTGVSFSAKNNDDIKIAGGTNITTAVSGNTVTITGPDTSSFITGSSTTTLTNKTIDANGTGNSITNIEVADLASGVLDTDISSVSGSDDTLASAKAIKTYADTKMSDLSDDSSPQLGGNLDLNGNDIVTTSNADIELAANGTGKVVVKGNTNPGTIVLNCENNSHGQTIKAQPHSATVTNTLTLPAGGDQEIVGTAATQTLTNKTLTSPVLNTGVSGTAILDEDNMASNSATQLATQQSIKAYVDAEVSGAGGGGVTVQDEGSALSTTATTLNFVGSGVTASGTGATKTITISGSGGSASTGDFTFTGNNMSTTSSNADMELGTSGTGMIVLKGNGGPTPSGSANRYDNGNVLSYYNNNVTPGSTRFYKNAAHMDLKMDGTNSSSSNDRFRAFNAFLNFDINGAEITNSGGSRGPMGLAGGIDVINSSSDTATIGNIVGTNTYNYIYNGASSGNGNVNITNAQAFRAYSPAEYDGISGTVTNAYGFYVGSPIAYSYSNSNLTVTNSYGYYYRHNPDNASFTNDPYAFYTNDDSVRSNPGALNKFNEYSYNSTHSANGAYTIDWANGNLQTVTLGANITGFTMSNFPTSTKQSVGVTLYLVQDGTGSRSMTFSATGGETFKFANGVTTSSVSSANDIQTVYIFSRYNGSANIYYWTLGPTYS